MIWLLSLKRLLRPATVCMLAVIFLSVWLGAGVGRQVQLRPCGVVCEDADAAAVCDALVQKGFLRYDNREAMARAISRGTLDCGVVLLPGLGQSVADGQPKGPILLLTAPDSFLTEAYEAHIGAALFSAAAPAMTVLSAAEVGVTLAPEDVEAELADLYASGIRFTFEIVTTDGLPPVIPDLGSAIARAAAALLLFAAILPGTRRAWEDTLRMLPRIGRRTALTGILIPGLFWQALLYTLAAGAAQREMLPALAAYVLLLTALGLVAARLPMQPGVLMPICLLGSLALYPIYYDLTETLPWTAMLRWLLPPCWLPAIAAQPGKAAALSVACLLAACAIPQRRHI